MMASVRIRRKVRFILMTAVIVLVLYAIIHSLVALLSSGTLQTNEPTICEITPEQRIKMDDTLQTVVKNILNTLDMTYFLCYDSLWGALGPKGPLKWHQSVDICLLNEEVVRFEEAFLIRAFKRNGLILTYQSSDGVYRVATNDNTMATIVRLYLFEQLNGNYRRVGWKNRLVPPDNCDLIHCFPTRLIAKPLPTEQFMSLKLPVPKEGIEIQKYLFPESWWLDSQPEECK